MGTGSSVEGRSPTGVTRVRFPEGAQSQQLYRDGSYQTIKFKRHVMSLNQHYNPMGKDKKVEFFVDCFMHLKLPEVIKIYPYTSKIDLA